MGGIYVIKVLLVDDEQYIREGLRQLVDCEEYGYEIKQPKGGSSHYSFVKPGWSRCHCYFRGKSGRCRVCGYPYAEDDRA